MGYWDDVLSEVAASPVMQGLWSKYVRLNSYARGISLGEACDTSKSVMRAMGWGDGDGE